MYYADDLNPLPLRPVDHQVHATGMDAYRGFELAAFPGHLRKVSEQVEERKQTVCIAIGLLYTPVVCAIVPDVGQVGFSGGSNDPTATLRHIRRASGT